MAFPQDLCGPSRCRVHILPSLIGVVAFVLLLWPGQAKAQLSNRGAPSQAYNSVFVPFYDGDYRAAGEEYEQLRRSGIRFGTASWIDSICYCAMIGECYYQMGNLEAALTNYTAALRLYLTFPDWMIRVQFPPTPIRPMQRNPQTPWGMSTRGAALGQYPQWFETLQGEINAGDRIKTGGVVAPAQLYPIQVQEIVWATALAIRRRAELLGPLCKFDPLTTQLVATLSQPVGPRNHWAQCWVDVQYGLALAAAEKDAEALPILRRSLMAMGQFDHPLTGVALHELGRLAMKQGDFNAASKHFIEATYSGYHYGDYNIVEEAFRRAALVHLVSNQKGFYPPLALAVRWAEAQGAKDVRQLRASLLLSGAENNLVLGQTAAAATMLNEAQSLMARRSMALGAVGARLNYLRATQCFQQRNISGGEEALGAAITYLHSGGSRWLFYISQVLRAKFTPRRTMDLYKDLLRDPQPIDWGMDPMESMAVQISPVSGAYAGKRAAALEDWFLLALRGADPEVAAPAALEISDRVRRHRFLSTLPFGGRLQSLRWILEAPEAALERPALLQRQDLLTAYPGYKAVSQQAQQVRDKLAAMPPVARDPEALRQQGTLLTELGKLSVQQEAILREIAVRREPATLVFPPLRSLKEVQKAMPEGSAMLVLFVAGGDYHAFLLNRTRCTYWTIKNAAVLGRRIASLLREMGNYEANREVNLKDLSDTRWKQSAKQVLDAILEGSKADFSKKFPELVVVPDGMFWYLPFEALQVSVDGQLQPLIARFRIRYAPTLGLSIPDVRGRNNKPDTAVAVGRLFPRAPETLTRTAFDELAKAVPGSVAVERGVPGNPALFKSRIHQLIVLEDLAQNDQAPYGWAPIPVDKGRAGSSLADWMALPWGGPEVMAFPGYHTMAENPMKRNRQVAAGSEMFLSACAMMATGARTILLSRWRTGGQSSLDLVREFAQELPNTTATDAYQRAVLLASESRLNLEAEPRIKAAPGDEAIKGQHPFIWAGYMLLDSGDPDQRHEAELIPEVPTGGRAKKAAVKKPEAKKPESKPGDAAEEDEPKEADANEPKAKEPKAKDASETDAKETEAKKKEPKEKESGEAEPEEKPSSENASSAKKPTSKQPKAQKKDRKSSDEDEESAQEPEAKPADNRPGKPEDEGKIEKP